MAENTQENIKIGDIVKNKSQVDLLNKAMGDIMSSSTDDSVNRTVKRIDPKVYKELSRQSRNSLWKRFFLFRTPGYFRNKLVRAQRDRLKAQKLMDRLEDRKNLSPIRRERVERKVDKLLTRYEKKSAKITRRMRKEAERLVGNEAGEGLRQRGRQALAVAGDFVGRGRITESNARKQREFIQLMEFQEKLYDNVAILRNTRGEAVDSRFQEANQEYRDLKKENAEAYAQSKEKQDTARVAAIDLNEFVDAREATNIALVKLAKAQNNSNNEKDHVAFLRESTLSENPDKAIVAAVFSGGIDLNELKKTQPKVYKAVFSCVVDAFSTKDPEKLKELDKTQQAALYSMGNRDAAVNAAVAGDASKQEQLRLMKMVETFGTEVNKELGALPKPVTVVASSAGRPRPTASA